MLNLSPLLFTTLADESCLHSNLDLTDAQRALIAEARSEVRSCLRSGIPRVLGELGYQDEVPQPRFFTQGSWAYKTLNAPAKKPQQADVDDGCYLPMSFVSQGTRPSVASAIFFEAAERALAPLVVQKKWKMGGKKDTCIRIEICDVAHIDIPLYAIPDSEFTALAKASMEQYTFDSIAEAVTFAERDAWTALPRDKVLLAHREENWKTSDPRPVKEWFLNEVEEKGEQFRRVVRYLKAYRDWHWESGGPSSILLMAAASTIFEKRDRRDDVALLDVVAGLPARLRSGVTNPVDSGESLTNRLGKQGVEEAAQAFESLEVVLRGSINASNPSQACTWMRGEFGNRFPDEADRIKVISVVATISATRPSPGPSELIGRSKAG